MTGPPDDPSERPTLMADYGAVGSPPPDVDDEPNDADSAESDSAPDPWYRNRVLLALWVAMVALLVVLIIYGLVELSRGGEGGGPSTTTPSTTTRSSTTSPTTTTTTPSSTTTAPETPEQTPEEAPPPSGAYSSAPAEPPRHHHHLPHIPSTITLPHTVVTLPHGF